VNCESSILGPTLQVINSLEEEGVIRRYAIGGAMGLLFYTEPVVTFDLDIFCYLPETSILISLGPVYSHLAQLGYQAQAEDVAIEGVPVQFLVPPSKLVEEALDTAVNKSIENVSTRAFSYEHLLAIMVETGRAKDRARIPQALESAEPDEAKLNDILQRYGLLDKWRTIVT